MNDDEVWKSIPGFSHYEASSHGRVRSLTRMVRGRHGNLACKKGKILKPIRNKGYLVVKLGGPNKAYGIHQAVAWAFHGERPDGYVVDHVDCNKENNRPENLEYVTNSENVFRQYRNGLLSNRYGEPGRLRDKTPKLLAS